MLRDLVARAPEGLQQEGADGVAMVGIDESQGVQGAPLAEGGPGHAVAGEVGGHEGAALGQVAPAVVGGRWEKVGRGGKGWGGGDV